MVEDGCAEKFNEAIDLTSDATVYGGLDCAAGWVYVGESKKTEWTAEPDAVPLHMVMGAREGGGSPSPQPHPGSAVGDPPVEEGAAPSPDGSAG